MRLIAFGCSNTYGSGLIDCFIPSTNGSGSTPSKFAWPQILADKLNMECVNTSRPGSSNKEILNTLLNFKFQESDVVVIMWSFVTRWCMLTGAESDIRPVLTTDHDSVLHYDKVFTIADLQLDFIYRANFAKLYLDNKKLKNYHLSVDPYESLPNVMPNWNMVNFSQIDLSMISYWMPKALDVANGSPHPGPEAHQIVATGLFEEISNAYNK